MLEARRSSALGRRGCLALAEQLQQGGLILIQVAVPDIGASGSVERAQQRAVQVGVDDRGMHVRLAANGRRVAEVCGRRGDGMGDVVLGLGRGVKWTGIVERLCGAPASPAATTSSWPRAPRQLASRAASSPRCLLRKGRGTPWAAVRALD